MNVFINGNIISEDQAYIHLKDRGLLLGDGIFETCRAEQGYILFFKEHYKRLVESAHFLSMPLPYTSEQLLATCRDLLELNKLMGGAAAIRITLTRGAGLRGINIPDKPQPTLFITAAAYATPNQYPTAFITSIKRNSHSPIVKHKTLNYLEPILARTEAQAKGFDEGIMLNVDGNISECSIANIFFIKDGVVTTPDLDSGILPGIVREYVITLCKKINIPIIEKKISQAEALNSDEAFQTNSLIGVQSLSAINEKSLAINKSPVSGTIFSAYNEFVKQSQLEFKKQLEKSQQIPAAP
ncbi:MAG: hypothetical protein A3F10_05680 [Coxiella sp. RIFCSPHIGHO2_12_FULL_42_15]|nr:MAG: hypothetical protein A3F10_05680 [Coxiella sp. RIFCSPHIGHO2_12_FULL_42_15]